MKYLIPLAISLLFVACGNQSSSAAANTAEEPAPQAAPKTAAELGQRAFGQCGICHSTREGEASRVGPNLFGVFGRAAGTGDFAYTDAVRNSNVTWDDASLDAFIEKPGAFIRGNRMSFAGVADAEKRENIIAYLKTLQSAED